MSVARLSVGRRVSTSVIGIHSEATAWAARVATNGGSVSASTISAVSTFCSAIDAAGIRDRFYRLNLFCGSGLASALVPLYRGPSSGATQLGNTTDTNNNFVSGDYNETGSSCGLNGNGTSKYLDTGLLANTFSATNLHLGIGLRRVGTGSGFRTAIGAFRYNNPSEIYHIAIRRGDAVVPYNCVFGNFLTPANSFGDAALSASITGGNILASWPTMYRNGSRSGTDGTATASLNVAQAIFVFAMRDGQPTGSLGVVDYSDIRVDWYSIGLNLSSSQVTSFNTALTAFQTALSRS